MNHSQSKSSPMFRSSSSETEEMQLKKKLASPLIEPDSKKPRSIETKSDKSEPLKKKRKREKKNRCFSCNKKVGLLGFECQCQHTYCSKCRMPEIHECSVDYKSQKKVLKKVVASKIDFI